MPYTLIAQLDRAQGYEPWFCGSSNLSGRASKVAETFAIIVNSDMGMDPVGSELGGFIL